MTDERRRRLVGAGASLAAFAVVAGLARGATSRPDSMSPARRELERAVRTGFAPGLVGLIARGDNADVMTVGDLAIEGPPMQRAISELGIVGFGPPDPAMPFDADEWMRRLGTLPLFAQPGE